MKQARVIVTVQNRAKNTGTTGRRGPKYSRMNGVVIGKLKEYWDYGPKWSEVLTDEWCGDWEAKNEHG